MKYMKKFILQIKILFITYKTKQRTENIENKYKICPRQIIINDINNKYTGHLFFLTTIFQLKLIKECNCFFINGTSVHVQNHLNKF